MPWNGFRHLSSLISHQYFANVLFLIFSLSLLMSLQAKDIRSVRSGHWSNPATWAGKQLPGGGDNVLIDSSHVVEYDVYHNKSIRLLHIRGELTFSRKKDTRLDVGMLILSTAKTVDVNGPCSAHQHSTIWKDAAPPTLTVGSMDTPIPQGVRAEIHLDYFSDMDDDCAPGIISYGGRMDFHGAPLEKTWVKMAKSAKQGDTKIILASPLDWQPGDHIIITRSSRPSGNIVSRKSYRVNGMIETEERYITAVKGSEITLDKPLNFSHPVWKDGKHAGEVAVLSRNVVVTSKNPGGVRGHTMYHLGSQGSISYAEFSHLGKAGKLARYPIHFHVARSSMRGSSVIGASIWDSHNRFVTIHGTNYIVVKDCIGYKSLGNGFFMEDATEIYNLFENNLAVQAYRTKKLPDQALAYDRNDGAGFWWANGRNAFLNNVANECDTYGYQFDIRPKIRGPILQPDGNIIENFLINQLPFIYFRGNEAHGTLKYGFWFRGDALEKAPFVIENLKIWGLWYSLQPDLNHFMIDNLDIWNVAYGIYGKAIKRGKITNYNATRTGNHAMSFQDTPEGLITFEKVTIDSSNEYPFKVYGRDKRKQSCEVHIRNYTVTNTEYGWKGAASTPGAEKRPDLTLFLHDWFGPNQDAKVIPAKQNRNDGLDYQNMEPVFKEDIKVARTSVDFPHNPIEAIDKLPPATTIIYPADGQEFPAKTRSLTIRGACLDASRIKSVKVNGIAAKPLAENFRYWEVQLRELEKGQLALETEAADEFGNKEQTPHKIHIGIGTAPKRLPVKMQGEGHAKMSSKEMKGGH